MGIQSATIKKVAKIVGYIFIIVLFVFSTIRIINILKQNFNYILFYGFLITLVQWYYLVKNMNLSIESFENIFLDLVLPIVNAFFFIIITIVNSFVGVKATVLFRVDWRIEMVCNILVIIGFTISLMAIIQLRRYFAVFAEAKGLVTGGLYKYVRHPIYSGYILVTFSMLIINFSVFETFLVVIYVFLFDIRAAREERLLQKQFGEEYVKYFNNTGKFIMKLSK